MLSNLGFREVSPSYAYRQLAILRWREKKQQKKRSMHKTLALVSGSQHIRLLMNRPTAMTKSKKALSPIVIRKKLHVPNLRVSPALKLLHPHIVQIHQPNVAPGVCPSSISLPATRAVESDYSAPASSALPSDVLPHLIFPDLSCHSSPSRSLPTKNQTFNVVPYVSEMLTPTVMATGKKNHKKKKTPPSSEISLENIFHNIASASDVLPAVGNCGSCGAVRFAHEPPASCCNNGDIVLVNTPLPSVLVDLLVSASDESKNFRSCIRTYNNHLAFTSLGANYDHDLSRRNKGIYTFRVQGQVYHFMPSLLGEDDSAKNLQFYLHDTEHEVMNRLLHCPRLYEMSLQKILTVLEENPYARFFRSLRNENNLEDHNIFLYCNPTVDQRTYNKPSVSQVAGILVDGTENHHRSIKIYTLSGQSHSIQYYYACYDPLQYPLLFPYGQLGWHQGIPKQGLTKKNRKRSRSEYTNTALDPVYVSDAQALLEHEEHAMNAAIENPNCVSIREYYCYRFQIKESDRSYLLHFGRLFQQYAVDMFVKLETRRLDYFRSQQDNIRHEFLQGVADAFAAGENACHKVGQRIVLPATFIGGPRHMRKKYLDAMSLVRKYGKPDIFLTMTCNPNWPEIKEHLKYGEHPQDRPDIACRIFRAKLEELKNELFKKNVFGKVAAYTYVVEFQKRGLSHAHFLLILKPQFKVHRPEEFDTFVSAEIPDKIKHPHLHRLVVKHMLHGPCGVENPSNVCMKKNGSCKDFYPRPFYSETNITDDAYPNYRRRDNGVRQKVRGVWLDNRWVVPYNPYLLAKFDCHMNVEICSTIKAVKYIYKYICKGSDRILFNVSPHDQHDHSAENVNQVNEIDQYRSGRWISAPESLWRMFRFPLTEMKPPVIQMHLHLENYQPVTFKHRELLSTVLDNPTNKRTMLTEFFFMNMTDSNAKARNCLYSEFPDHFVWLADKKKWKLRARGNSVGRVVTVQPTEGERYFLRLLLSKVRCPTSYMYLKTVHGRVLHTYHDAALELGLLEQNNSQEQCMADAALYNMPAALRKLFADLLVHSCPSNPTDLWSTFETAMSADFTFQLNIPTHLIRRKVLAHINSYLVGMGKSLRHYNICQDLLLEVSIDSDDSTKEITLEKAVVVSASDLASEFLLNDEQKSSFDCILASIYQNKPRAFFIDGPGGTGKTFLYRALLAHVRSKGHIALATATSGIAAALLPGGRTAHSRFKIPIDLEDATSCRISEQSSLATLIKESKLILWDEAPMAKRTAVEALDSLLKDLMESNLMFGGKVVVLGGDFRQTLPVVAKGSKAETINASLIKSPLWAGLVQLWIFSNMRARLDPQFTKFLLAIGDGTQQSKDIDIATLPDHICYTQPSSSTNLEDFISLIYPNLQETAGVNTPFLNRAILTTKNSFVDEINEIIIDKFPGTQVEYIGFDQTLDPSDQGLYEDMINSLSPNGLPPHKLVLKQNAPIILLRNIDPSEGLCNGTRLLCRQFSRNVLHAEIVTGDFAGRQVFIPRIPLQPTKGEFCPVPYKRTQFPVRLCFAMTINKSQGQTLDFVGVYLKEHVFSNGQLYVALSRARTSSNVKVFINNSICNVSTQTKTRNVVYKEVLRR